MPGNTGALRSMGTKGNQGARDSVYNNEQGDEFIRLEQSKPREMRRWSDEDEAKAILHARFDNELAMLVKSDEAAGCQPPNCERKASIGG